MSSAYINRSIRDYVENLSRKQPSPGGGSASALVAALGAALNVMLLQYNSAKEEPKRNKFTVLLEEQTVILEELNSLVDKDCEVLDNLIGLIREKKATDESYAMAADIPKRVCELAFESLEITAFAASVSKKIFVSDVLSAAQFLKAAFTAGEANVLVNLKYMSNRDNASKIQKELSGLRVRIDRLYGEVKEAIKGRSS
ncbi:MAG: cyclodeaminase/cyclohydrolase family protein [Candidatus Omnitrophica bacterium]|nr:cyclodeaminase/cyclohydrolase family protein [Candidatus Omnitrophota bacterium]